jgi:hypothetical protein
MRIPASTSPTGRTGPWVKGRVGRNRISNRYPRCRLVTGIAVNQGIYNSLSCSGNSAAIVLANAQIWRGRYWGRICVNIVALIGVCPVRAIIQRPGLIINLSNPSRYRIVNIYGKNSAAARPAPGQ